MCGYAQDKELALRIQNAKFTYGVANISGDGTGTTMSEDDVKGKKSIPKKDLKEEIAAMAILKRADKRRYGNLQISQKNHICSGKIITQIPSRTCYDFK